MVTSPLSATVPLRVPAMTMLPLTVKSVPAFRMLAGLPVLGAETLKVPSTTTFPLLLNLAFPLVLLTFTVPFTSNVTSSAMLTVPETVISPMTLMTAPLAVLTTAPSETSSVPFSGTMRVPQTLMYWLLLIAPVSVYSEPNPTITLPGMLLPLEYWLLMDVIVDPVSAFTLM